MAAQVCLIRPQSKDDTMTNVNSHSAVFGDRMISLLDKALLQSYAMLRGHVRLMTNMLLALLPLMILLVGSCKTSDMQAISVSSSVATEYRAALFPDSSKRNTAGSTPAAGYVVRARKLMENNPAALKRLTQQEVVYMFGKPEMERHDADARIWQYSSAGCVVDFYFYAEDGRKDMDVAYVDYRFGGMTPAETKHQQGSCLHKIARSEPLSILGIIS